ncbi:MAG: peptide ABC transporter substrate-binding protein [Gemmatimonadaceae bacterium]
MPTFSRISTRRARLLAPVLVASLAVAGCKGTEDAKVAGPNDVGGTMVLATAADATSLLPGLVTVITDRQVTDMLYDRLADISDNLNAVGDKGFKPQLAERWEWAPDSLSIVFHLNPHAKWHDGQPVRASDVRYSLNLIKDPAFGSPAGPLVTNIDSVSVRDSTTAVVYFKRHTPEQFYDLAYQVSIVPEHVLGNTPAGKLKDSEVARRGIGSGRFRLAKWEAGSRIEIVADTANYRGRAKLDRVVFAISPDFNAAVTRFFAGDADMFENLRTEQLTKLVGDTARRSVAYPALAYGFLAFNLVDPKEHAKSNPVFGERAVRRALTMAVDRAAMLKNVFDTIGVPLHGPFPASLLVSDTTLPQIAHDTVKARALLDSAGWVPGPDGIRVKNGQRLEFGITIPSSSAARRQYAVLLQDAFRRIGASAKLDESDFASYVAKQGNRGFDTEMAVYNTDPSVSGFKQSWSSYGIGKDGTNWTSYSNPAVDALLDSALITFDPARTKAYGRKAFERIIEDAPGIWLYEPSTRAGIARRIRTTPMRADGWWSGLADWWIPASQRNARDKIGLRPAQ